jgi:hypothetical protein
MDMKRWLMATAGAFGVIAAGDYLIHNVWLSEIYAQTAQYWRSPQEMQARIGFMVGGQLALAGLLALVYAKGYEPGKGAASQGFRFGVMIGLLLGLPRMLIEHAVYPFPTTLVLNWFLGGLVEASVAGIIIGYLYKPANK